MTLDGHSASKSAKATPFCRHFRGCASPLPNNASYGHTNQPWRRRMPLNVKRNVSSGIMLSDLSLIHWTRGKSAVQFEWAKIELKSHVIRTHRFLKSPHA
jgi:hypothetical protein